MTDPIDWTDAFENGAYIANAAEIRDGWSVRAEAFRATAASTRDVPYGDHARAAYDLFQTPAPKGTLIFVHGGYWHQTDKNTWSHLAAGAIARGWNVAMPSYPLAPEVPLGQITAHVARAVRTIMDATEGPVALAGHSAGGHLVTRMACPDIDLPRERITRITSISGLHDLRPLRHSAMNETLGLSSEEATQESPALHTPVGGTQINAVVGAAERPEFLRQTRLLAEAWQGQIDIRDLYVPGTNHFTVIDALTDPGSALMTAVLGPR